MKYDVVIRCKNEMAWLPRVILSLNKQSIIYFAEESAFSKHTSDLKGNYQKLNIRTVLQTIEILKHEGIYSVDNCFG